MRRVGVEILGNAASVRRAFGQAGAAAGAFGREVKGASVQVEKAAVTQVRAAVRTQARLEEQVAAYKALGAAATRGSREQVAAANLAAEAQLRLAKATATTKKESSLLMAQSGRMSRGMFGRRTAAREAEALGLSTVYKRGLLGTVRERFGTGASLALTGFGPGTLTAAALGFGAYESIKQAARFQSEQLLLRTQAGAPDREIRRMNRAILDMAIELGQTPEALSKALYHIESYRYRGKQARNFLRIAAQGAAVGHDDIEATTNALLALTKRGSMIKGAGRTNAQRMGLIDAIIGAGNMRMADFTKAMATGVLGPAASFGISMPELGAAIATMTHAGGMSADTAATRLRTAFQLIAAGSDKAEKQLSKIGLSTEDLADTLRKKGLGAAIEEIKAHLDAAGLNKSQQAALISRAFGGARGASSIFTLINQSGNYAAVLEQIERQTGRFGSSWKKTQQTASFAMMRIKAAAQVVGVELGAALLPTVTRLIIRFGNWINRMQKSGQLQRDIKKITHDMGVAFKIAAGLIAGAARAATKLAHAFGGWKTAAKFLLAGLIAKKTMDLWIWLTKTGGVVEKLIKLWKTLAKWELIASMGGGGGKKGVVARIAKYGMIGAGAEATAAGAGAAGAGAGVAGAAAAAAPTIAVAAIAFAAIEAATDPKRYVNLGTRAGGREVVYVHDGKFYLGFTGGKGGQSRMEITPEQAYRYLTEPGARLTEAGRRFIAAVNARRAKSTTSASADSPGRAPGRGRREVRRARQDHQADAAEEKAREDVRRARLRAAFKETHNRLGIPYSILDAVTRAKTTKGYQDDMAALKQEERYLEQRLAHTKKNTKLYHDLLEQLASVHRAMASIARSEEAAQKREEAARKKREEAARKARDARQFRLLGLGPSGEDLPPTLKALKRELGNVSQLVKGTVLDTDAHKKLLRNIRRLLSGQLGALSSEVRGKIKELLDDLKSQLDEFDGFNLTAAEKRRRFLDRELARQDRYRAHGPRHDPPGKVEHHHHYSPTINTKHSGTKNDLEKQLRRDHFRHRHAFAH